MAKARKINVVYIIDGLGWGGAERLMPPVLKNLDKDLFNTRVCVLQNKDGNPIATDLVGMNVPVDFLPIRYLRDITAVFRLRDYLRRVDADLVHTQLEFSNVFGNIAAKMLRLPSVSTVHTIPTHGIIGRQIFHQKLEIFSLRFFCDKVIFVSDEARQFHLRIGGFSPKKAEVIYNGIELLDYLQLGHDKASLGIRREFSIPASAKVLITVAVLRELKGIQFMIRALPLILEKYPDVYYLIVGSGGYREALEKEVKSLGLTGRVVFAGRQDAIPSFLASADIFVLPSLTEALPTVLAEAMAAHLPIVACKVGGIPEMIIDNVNGILITPENPQALANACISLLDDDLQLKSMGEAGWKYVNEKFNIYKQIENLRNLYIGMMNSYEK
ncbi:MAG: glycosyltransferase [Anaerolineales bacterium]